MSDDNTGHRDHPVLGMLAATGAFLMFTVMNVLAKLLTERHSVIEIAFYRNLVALLPFLFLVFVLGRHEIARIRSKPGWILLRAIFGTVSLALTFYAYSLMPMADTTAYLFASSLFVPVFGIAFLGERVGVYRWAAVAAGFAGVVIMARPSGDVYALGITVALTAALIQAGLQIILRYLGRHERPETITFWFFLVGLLVTAIPLPWIAVRPTLEELPLLIGVGLAGGAAQFMLSAAFRYAAATVVTIFNYTGIVWATLFGWLIWNEWPLPIVMVGASIVVVANLLIVWRESRLREIRGSGVRAKL
ncbi:MAG: DMT family transporter [Woeseiaceae bacterium]|nr:DMT family transporter [Woeseiaceae bacterium]